jgi:hypothetical protein
MNTETINTIKGIIALSSAQIFYFTGVFVVITEMFLIGGKATGNILDTPAYYVMIASGVLHLTSPFWNKSTELEPVKEEVIL